MMAGPPPAAKMRWPWVRPRLLSLSILLLFLAFTHGRAAAAGPVVAGVTIPPAAGTVYLPLAFTLPAPPPTYDAIPVIDRGENRPAEEHADLNLALRGYITTTAELALIDLDGPSDPDAPQLAAIFDPPRLPAFSAVYQVYNWDWGCGEDGCRGEPIAAPPVTLLAAATAPGEPLTAPARGAEIYAGGYKALVLYTAPERITLVYTREDTAANGYVVHLEGLAVEPALAALYTELNASGRKTLPALRSGEHLGRAAGSTLRIAVRDTGSFLDPRSRKDWWQGY